jgi:putative ABC transport system permease protein
METPRWKKVWIDLWANKTRTLLVVLSIAVGVFAVGVIASSFYIVKQDMAADYTAVNPHTARIYTEDFGPDLLAQLSDPELSAIEARYNLWVKVVAADGKEYPINIDSIGPVATLQVDQLVFEKGSPELADGEIYLERQGAAGLGLEPGATVDLLLNDGQRYALRIAGTVHDVGANPFNFTNQTSGYVTPATMAMLGGSALHNYVTFVTTGSPTDAVHVRQIADRVAQQITAAGYRVYNVHVNHPGQHPAQSIIDTVLALMSALGVLTVFLSGFLVTNTISALMGQQIRQIGMMKAVGATMFQVTTIYLALVLAFGLLALLIAVPLAALAAYGLTHWLVGMLNATPSPFTIAPVSLALQLLIGLAVPLLAALVPILGGARLTVRQAITSYGLNTSARPGLFDRLIESVRGLPRPLLLSLRNTFRRKGRLALTLSTLTLGGAIFIAMFSVRESLHVEISQTLAYYQSDVNVELAEATPLTLLQAVVAEVPGVTAVEGWQTGKANVLHTDGLNSDQVFLFAPPSDSQLVEPVMLAGRWLRPDDENTIVVDNHFAALRPDVGIGETIQVRLDGQDVPFQVVGIFRLAGNMANPFTYVNYETLSTINGAPGEVNSLRIVTDRHDAARQDEVREAVRARLAAAGFEATLRSGHEIIEQQQYQVNLLISLLLVMGVLIATVGGLGLMGTMGMNVLERTREIGVMRSIGAENRMIFQLVWAEGLLIGLLSWFLSFLTAVPITYLLDNRMGLSLMTVPLVYLFSTRGLFIWLAVALALATAASLLPARNAVRLTVRDVLSYE